MYCTHTCVPFPSVDVEGSEVEEAGEALLSGVGVALGKVGVASDVSSLVDAKN